MPTPGCKFPKIRNGNGRADLAKIGKKRDEQQPEEEDADGEGNKTNGSGSAGGVGGGLDITTAGGLGRLCGWPSSRIVRVSRASGGKDRHSKVWTSKGLRDRRVRLSVNTAIQFYDLQDRLGYDQPSKAVEWLLKAAASSIAELPSINTSFPDTPQQLSDEKRSSVGTEHGFDSAEVEMDGELYQPQQQQHQHGGNNFSKSACSSTSETSKGSGLSLSRSESRIKARERARERAAEKEKEKEHHNVNPISQNSSFTELLTGGMNNSSNVSNTNTSSNNNTTSPNSGNNGNPNESNFFQKSPRQWSSTSMDYFATGLLGLSSTRATNQSSTSFLGQIQLGNSLHQSLTAMSSPLFSVTGEHHPELQHFSFAHDHLVQVVAPTAGNSHANSNSNGNGSDYNLNFTISPSSSSGFAGFNRGTLQSNSSSPSLLPHQVQRFSTMDRSSAFFATSAPPNSAVAPVEDHHHPHPHHFLQGFDARLQLCYGDGGRQSDQKGKGKN